MKPDNLTSSPPAGGLPHGRVAFIVLALLVPLSLPLLLHGLAGEHGARLAQADVFFCMLTFTNCTPYSLFNDVMAWPELLALNAIAFGIWLLYTFSARAFVTGQAPGSRFTGGFFAVLIPLAMALFGAATVLLQGATL